MRKSLSGERIQKRNHMWFWIGGIVCLVIITVGIVYAKSTKQDEPAQAAIKLPLEAKREKAELILTTKGQTFALNLSSVGYDGKQFSSIDQKSLLQWLQQVKKKVDQKPVNAKADRINGTIQKGKVGQLMDLEKLEAKLQNIEKYINQPIEIPMIEKQPQVTSQDIKLADKQLIGTYTTYFDGKNINRTINIRLASQAIDNLVLLPGEKFSFNQVVGERTEQRGYKKAGVIVKGEFSEGIGGGICQVSSTLYNSVDRAGLKIVRRFSHSATVTYVPPNRDATVSWGGPDFRFENNLEKPIVLKIKVGSDRMVVETYTVPGIKVKGRVVPDAPTSVIQTPAQQKPQTAPQKPVTNLPMTQN